ncbi:5-oxoprolinase subunit PxpA [Burkholderiaceae bacterium DAT-1]|nr:5-oxoprolinase subunit PxpA [Burkholderiaceae bacterium DAT-1]
MTSPHSPDRTIDLNADVGEGAGYDVQLLQYVSSINIACGWHAGSAIQMQALVRAAIQAGVAIGAHPGYLDPEHFGRREMQLPLDEVRAGILYQVGALQAIVNAEGGRLTHVKPHGALYNQAARDPALAKCIADAVADIDPMLAVTGLANSVMIDAIEHAGLKPLSEGFADRGYTESGHLVPRSQPGALLASDEAMLMQMLCMVRDGCVHTRSGTDIRLQIDTICLHGDGQHALQFAQRAKDTLLAAGIRIASPHDKR